MSDFSKSRSATLIECRAYQFFLLYPGQMREAMDKLSRAPNAQVIPVGKQLGADRLHVGGRKQMLRTIAIIFAGLFATGVTAQESNFYIEKGSRVGNIYFVTFAELTVFSRELDGKVVDINGFCEGVPRNGKDFFYFSSREASDRMDLREAVALSYSEPKPRLFMDVTLYEKWKKIVNHHQCNVLGMYSMTPKKFGDALPPSRGSISIYDLRGGMGRIENEPQHR